MSEEGVPSACISPLSSFHIEICGLLSFGRVGLFALDGSFYYFRSRKGVFLLGSICFLFYYDWNQGFLRIQRPWLLDCSISIRNRLWTVVKLNHLSLQFEPAQLIMTKIFDWFNSSYIRLWWSAFEHLTFLSHKSFFTLVTSTHDKSFTRFWGSVL